MFDEQHSSHIHGWLFELQFSQYIRSYSTEVGNKFFLWDNLASVHVLIKGVIQLESWNILHVVTLLQEITTKLELPLSL